MLLQEDERELVINGARMSLAQWRLGPSHAAERHSGDEGVPTY